MFATISTLDTTTPKPCPADSRQTSAGLRNTFNPLCENENITLSVLAGKHTVPHITCLATAWLHEKITQTDHSIQNAFWDNHEEHRSPGISEPTRGARASAPPHFAIDHLPALPPNSVRQTNPDHRHDPNTLDTNTGRNETFPKEDEQIVTYT